MCWPDGPQRGAISHRGVRQLLYQCGREVLLLLAFLPTGLSGVSGVSSLALLGGGGGSVTHTTRATGKREHPQHAPRHALDGSEKRGTRYDRRR